MGEKRTVIQLDELTVTSETVGIGSAPWGEGESRHEYRVLVEAPEGSYETRAWGSIAAYAEADYDAEGIGYMVLDELASAANDPDEFFSMATEGEGGRERAVAILAVIEKAEQLASALERNEEAIDERR